MSAVSEVVQTLKSLESDLGGYMAYDSMVAGLVSRSIKTLAETRKILSKPTKKNAQEALRKIEGVKNDLSPYASYAPALVIKIESIIGKLQVF